MARTIAVWGATGLATPTCKLMLDSALTSVVETITLAEHATVKRLYTGTVTASAGHYRYNLLTAGVYVGGGSIYVGGTDATTYEEDGFGNLSNTTVKINAGITKNTALDNFTFFMTDSSDHVSGKTGLTVTATRSLDGAAFAACANAVTELSNGWYVIDLAAADMNGDFVALKFTATGADATNIALRPTP